MALFFRRCLAALDLDTSESFDCFDAIGHGLYQQRLLFPTFVLSFLVHVNILSFYLISGDVDHWCRPPPDWTMSVATWRNSAIPLEADGSPSQCTVYKNPADPNDTDVVACDHWDYDPKNEKKTIVSSFNLVCHRRPLIAVIQLVYITGSVVLPSIAGYLADSVGRLPVLLMFTAALIVGTCGSCFADTYVVYVVIRFVISGCSGAAALVSCMLAFEVTRHEYRTTYTVAVTFLAILLSELWYDMVRQLSLERLLLQAIFLAPTDVALSTFWFADESVRWLIFSRNMASAEAVMLAAAKMNNVPLPTTACLLNKLKAEALKSEERLKTLQINSENSWAKYIPIRALFMFVTYFSATFTYIVLLQSSLKTPDWWARWLSLPSHMLTTLLAYTLIGRVRPLELLIRSYGLLGGLVCLLSVTIGGPIAILGHLFVIPAEAFALAVNVLAGVCVCDVFHTRVRGTALGWSFGIGRVGGVRATFASALRNVGREDALLGMAACVMFLSVAALIWMPGKNTGPTINLRRVSATGSQSLDHMKMTLEPLACRKHDRRRASYDSRRSNISLSSRKHSGF
ncbi:solute carrier family 22 member 7-like [Dermacentor variabilis]|uniref:solute carrier family 22 member 7-like n=1 Tax=Dermacentor variabilis TaxID=34621 RepID=UPI003F5B698F